ncbi:MAG: histidinol-phosphatase HisJ family protein [Lachnospiraceae bacterium]|nr:histidinol-phosphatase HisJ family protein [Lachnospiraceae bacterium]
MRDMHVHTEFSCDSDAKMEDYIEKAKASGIGTICFTDHVDLNTNDYGYNYYSADRFWERFNEIKYNADMLIEPLAGIEFGEPHLYEKNLKELTKYPYDFVIGSIHWIGDMFPCQKVREQYSAKEFYTLYWKEVLKTVQTGGFDALGHIDFPKRYYGEIYYEEAVINEIFRNLLEKDLVIEINTSSLRKGHAQTMPGKELLEIYKANGGKYVTIGSDAHVVEDIGADYETAKSMLEEVGLQEVIYRQRKRQII